MDEEVAKLKEKMEQVHIIEKAGMQFYRGTLCDREVVVVKCGVGKVHAAMCTQAMIDLFPVDGLGVGDVGNIVLRDRQHLSQDGLIVIVLTMDSNTGEVVAGPDVISRGFVYVRESENLMDDVKSVVRHEISKCEQRGIRDWSTIKSTVRENLRDYIFMKTKRNP